MAALNQISVEWSGAGITGPSHSTFWTDTAHLATAQVALKAWTHAMRSFLCTGASLSVPATGNIYDDVTGINQGTWNLGAGSQEFGNGSTNSASPCGALLRLQTQTLVGRRRLAGHIFLVPLHVTAYGADGKIEGGARAGMATAAFDLLTNGGGDFLFKIWHRPKHGAGGLSAFVSSSSINANVAVLTSRRD